MEQIHTEALTLRTYPYAEAHLIVVFLSREHGQVRAIAHGARKSKRSRFGSCLDPFSHSRIDCSRKEGKELATLKDAELLRAFPAYELSWEANLHFGYFAELLLEFTRQDQSADPVVRLTLAVLGQIDQKPVELLARYFELWLLRLEGVLPELSTKLDERLAAKAQSVLKSPPHAIRPDALSKGELKRLESLTEELIEYHLEKRLKTRKMLKELLS